MSSLVRPIWKSDMQKQSFSVLACYVNSRFWDFFLIFTARKRSLGQGNVFTSVCDSVHREGVSAPLYAGIHTPLANTPKADTPPSSDTMGYGQQAGGTHPTGMHTCYRLQMKFVKVMFSQVSVCPQGGVHGGMHCWVVRGMHGRGCA